MNEELLNQIVKALRENGCVAVVIGIAVPDGMDKTRCIVAGDYDGDTTGASAITGLLQLINDLNAVDFQALGQEGDKLWKIH